MKTLSYASITACALSTLFTQSALAQQSYNTELGINYSSMETNNGTGSTLTTPFARLYFNPVNTRDKPLAEAAFLDRTGSASIALLQGEGRVKTTYNQTQVIDSLGLRFSIDGRQHDSDTTIQLLFIKYDSEAGSGSTKNYPDIEVKSYGIGLGQYISNTQHIGFEYQNTTNNSTLLDLESYTYRINTKMVRSLGGDSAFNLMAGINRTSTEANNSKTTNTNYPIKADYYFNPAFSLGAGITVNRGDDLSDEGTTLSFNTGYFISPAIELAASIASFSPSYPDVEEYDTWIIGIRGRF